MAAIFEFVGVKKNFANREGGWSFSVLVNMLAEGEREMEYVAEEENFLRSNNEEATKGGLRTIPFILVNESFERLASIGLTPNMVFYLMDNYHMEVTVISTIFSLWSSLSNSLSIFGAAIADSYLGRFRVIVFGSFFSLAGMTGVWLTAMFPQLRGEACGKLTSTRNPPNAAQLSFLFLCFALMSIGAGCIRPCSLAFGIDQLQNKQNCNNKRLLQSFISWYNISIAVASIIAVTVIVYIQDQFGWKVGFAVPVILMLFSAIMILIGYSLYVHVKPSKSLFTGLFQVLVVAFRKRNVDTQSVLSDEIYHKTSDTELFELTDSLRFLNRACIIENPERDLNPDGTASNPWNLCTVEQVESLKAVIRIIPMWSTGVMLMLSLFQNSFSTLQAKSMNRHVIGSFEFPAASVSVIMLMSLVLWLSFYDRVILPILAKITGNPRGLNPEVRMAISLILSTVSMLVSSLVEGRRRKLVVEKGLADDLYASIDMSAMWLAPQYVLMGVADGISTTSQAEFFYLQLPRNMSSIAMALLTIEQAAASLVGAVFVNVVNKLTSVGGKTSWLASNINKGHIDYYYWLIAFMGFLNFFYFLICLRAFHKNTDIDCNMYYHQVDQNDTENE